MTQVKAFDVAIDLIKEGDRSKTTKNKIRFYRGASLWLHKVRKMTKSKQIKDRVNYLLCELNTAIAESYCNVH